MYNVLKGYYYYINNYPKIINYKKKQTFKLTKMLVLDYIKIVKRSVSIFVVFLITVSVRIINVRHFKGCVTSCVLDVDKYYV